MVTQVIPLSRYDLAHLGLIAGIMDRIGLVETVDSFVGPRPGEKVSTGMALKAAVLNALGLVSSPLYLFGHFFQGKPTALLLGPGVTPDLLNDDRMGRMLDTLFEAGVTEVFLQIARSARTAFSFPVQALHVDSTSFHVHGVYGGGDEGPAADEGEEPLTVRITHGYSRDHRPDLKQWVMNLVCADTGGIPLFFAPGNGNQSDREALVRLVALLVYALGEWELRQKLLECQASLPDQKGKPTQRPTLRWVFQLFIWVRLVVLEGQPQVLNLAPHHATVARLLGVERYYLLE